MEARKEACVGNSDAVRTPFNQVELVLGRTLQGRLYIVMNGLTRRENQLAQAILLAHVMAASRKASFAFSDGGCIRTLGLAFSRRATEVARRGSMRTDTW